MDRKELYEYLKTLNPQDFKEVVVANPAMFLRSIRDRLIKAKDVTKVIKRLINQHWIKVQKSDKTVILVGIHDDTLIAIYVKINFSYVAQHYEAEQVIIEQRSIRQHKVNERMKHVVLEDTVACSDYEETEDCIIVDDVDVSNCEFFNAKYEGCHCYNTKRECYAINPNEHHSCEGVNCNYKKLKRILSKGSLDNE